ncbi:hypothetical protein NE857_10470 [Nocardiopsis exhalans]|uniref:FtsX-like permease family protein n=1 Tax=Nocardiopsis exhalans TaxID=163604 RepID=A0ABY5DCD7_9ACTN|nr:hypothetical protein [Nocardiopsis exhalans]USY21991.1 hypothetical protein NE857_10470 [Nocardiopsis exhalans]
MPNRTLTFAYVVCAVFASILAFLLAAGVERTQYVLEDTGLVWISENDGTGDTDEVAASVQRVADDHGAAIGYAILDVNEPSATAHLYLAVPDSSSPQAEWLTDGYPAFGRGFTVRTHPIADFGGVGPNGHYLVFGGPEAETALRAALAEHGLQEAPGTQITELWHYFTSGHLFHLLVIALLGAATAAGAGVLLASRDYGVMRLQGHSYPRLLATDLLKVARLAAVVLPLVAAAALVFLGAYNGWNQLGLYSLTALVFLGFLAVPCLFVHAAVLGLVHSTDILAALKGRLPVRSTSVAVYLVRAPVLVLTLIILGSIVTAAQDLRDQRVQLELARGQGEASFLSLSANYGWADDLSVDDELGPWLRRADTDGDMVLVIPGSSTEFLPPGPTASWDSPDIGQQVLFVNNTYLAEQEVLSPSGERYGPAETLRVLVPESAAAHSEDIVEGVTGTWLELHGEPGAAPEAEVLPAAEGQTLFTYAAKRFDDPRPHLPLLHEPVVIVLPNGAVLSDSAYIAYMTARSTVFPDPGVVADHRAQNPEASRYIAMVETLTVNARHEQALTLNILRSELFNLIGAAAVLLLTAMAACVVHVRSRAQEIFARHINGWAFVSVHRRLLLVEGAIALAFLGWAVWDTLTGLATAADPARAGVPGPSPSGAEPFYALGIVLVCLVITVTALALFHRKIVREGASQA